MNNFSCIGRLTGEPETRFTTEGKGITTFKLAVNNTKNDATFIKITTFDKVAEIIQKYCHKGDMILINGMIKNNDYQDKDGNKHYEYVFVGNKVEFLSKATNNTKKEESAKKVPKNESNNIPSDDAFRQFGDSLVDDDSELAF